MSPSLRELQLLETYLQGDLPALEEQRVRQRLLLEPAFYERLQQQRQLYRLIRQYGRRQLKRELEQIHQELYGKAR